MLYPTEVQVNEVAIARLITTYKRAYISIYNEIATSTQFGARRRRAILTGIEGILKELGVDTDAFIKEQIPLYYEAGANDAIAQLKKIYAPISVRTGFNKIHRDAIAALISESSSAFGESLTAANKAARTLMSSATKEILTQQLATGNVSGAALRRIKRELVGTIQEQGIFAFKSRPYTIGDTVVQQTWTLDRYTEMLTRTKFTEARNTGLINRMVENGYDLVQVSKHNSAHKACAVWEGKILSITGETKEYPTVEQARKTGLFHPQCKHAINALHLELARETMAWNPQTRQYEVGILE
jgi:hypothetical protein